VQIVVEESENNSSYTEDTLLGGRITVRQPTQGYRVAIDPLLLAASVSVDSGETILDVGAGVGAVGLCLAARVPYCRVMGIESQKELVRLGAENILLNNLRDRVELLCGDLQSPPPRLAAGSYSQVISNPPYFESGQGRLSPFSSKSLSNHEQQLDMEKRVRFCLLMLKPMGTITFIYRADAIDRLLNLFYEKVGNINIFPLWPSKEQPAKRVIIQGIKGIKGGVNLLNGMYLHNEDGSFSKEADAILRDGKPIHLSTLNKL
jgi:tRNA1(Val) A37 N6-methylase TrmN6